MSVLQLTQTIQIVPSAYARYEKQPVQPMLPGLEEEEASKPVVTNRQIAEVLSSIADLLQFQNSNPYRIQAYRNAARGVLDLNESAALIVERGELLPVPGLGRRLQARIAELTRTGTMTFYHDLSYQTLTSAARALLPVEHVGPHVATRLSEELGIDSPDKLRRAALAQRIRKLPGFGERSEQRLKEAAESFLGRQQPEELVGAA
jgi:DNA polymerase/3'-5' exonuclease PolX